ncbi:MAG TPA: LPS assembly lipoprotein LptE [Bryobacteraceae bacterium]|jgi:hypothetical protein
MKRLPTRALTTKAWLICVLTLLAAASCGYHVGGAADVVPKSIRTISIPAFRSNTTRYRLVDTFPQTIGREFMARTRFRMENDPAVADAVLNGSVLSVIIFPSTTNPSTGIPTSITVRVMLSVTLVERVTGRVLYTRSNWPLTGTYAVASDAANSAGTVVASGTHQFFDESGPAFDRLTRDMASQLVSGVVENF